MDPLRDAQSLPSAPPRLSSAQKRDLAGQALAAVITVGLVAAPLVLPRTPIVATTPAPVQQPQIQMAAASPAVAAALPSSAPLRSSAPRARRPALALQRRPLIAAPVHVETVALVAEATTGRVVAEDSLERTDKIGKKERKPFGRRLAGLFTGDGSYSVRPFPTVSTER